MTTEGGKGGGKEFWKISWVQNTLVVLLTAAIAMGMARYEVQRRAKQAYKEGEAYLEKGDYRRALWSYQEVLDFYTKPPSEWVEKAREKVRVCEDKLKDEDPIQALDALLGITPSATVVPSGSAAPVKRN